MLLGADAALGVVAALLVLVQAALLAHVAARAFGGASLASLGLPLVLLAAAAAGRASAAWGFEVAGRRAATTVLSELRLDLVERRLRDRPAALDGARSTEIATVAVTGVDALETTFARYLPQLVLAVVVPVAVLVLVASIDLVSAGVMLLTLPLVPIFMWLLGRYTERRADARWRALGRLASHFADVVRGLPTLRAFNRAEAQTERIARVSDEYRRTTMGTLRVAFLSGTVLELAATLGIALVAVTVGVRLVEGGLGFEAGLTVLVLAPELYLPLRNLAAQFHASADGLAVTERLLELLEEAPTTSIGAGHVAPSPRTRRCGSRESRSCIRRGRSSCSTRSISSSRPARRWRLSARAGAARARSPRCSSDWWSRRAAARPSGRRSRILRRGRLAGADRLGAAAADPVPRLRGRQHPARNDRAADGDVRTAAALAGADAFVASCPTGTRPSSETAAARFPPASCNGSRSRARSCATRPSSSSTSRRRISIPRAPSSSARPSSACGRDAPFSSSRTARARPARRPRRHARLRPDRRVCGGGRMIQSLGQVVGLARVPRSRAALSVLLGALAVSFGIALMTTAGYLISRAAEQPPILSLTVTIVAVRFFGLARPLARYLDRLYSHDLALRALGGIRARFYERIEPLAPAQLEGFRRGDLLARMIGDVDALQGLYVRGLGPPLVALVVGAVSVGVVAAFLPTAAMILAAGLLVAGIAVPSLAWAVARAAGRRQAAARGELTAELVELLRGAPELVVYGREEKTIERISTLNRELARLGRRDALAAGLGDALSILVAGLTVVGVLAVAVSATDTGALDRVLVATLALLALSSFDAVSPLPGAARELSAMVAAGRRIQELIDRRPAVEDPVAPLPPPPRRATVALEGVTALYGRDERPALAGVDLRLEPGRRIALVGPSGAGKTTVTNLLLRFLDPEDGRVTIAGRDVREYRQEDVRRQFALAGQEAHVFDSTIRENLRLARPTASEADLEAALASARLDEWVAGLPKGLDTFVGEDGTRMSGGQRQRLTLARALLVDAPVLVLDEPTAHLDPETAQALMQDVLTAAGNRTVLLITHRPEGLDAMDEVVRLESGLRA